MYQPGILHINRYLPNIQAYIGYVTIFVSTFSIFDLVYLQSLQFQNKICEIIFETPPTYKISD